MSSLSASRQTGLTGLTGVKEGIKGRFII